MTSPSANARHHIAFALAVALLLSLAYSNSFGPGSDRPADTNWTNDNRQAIALDARLKATQWNDRPDAPGAVSIWTRDYWWPNSVSGLYRPIVTYSYRLNWQAFTDAESRAAGVSDQRQTIDALDQVQRRRLWWFHAVNLAAHFCVTMLVYATSLVLTRRARTAVAIGVLFAAHPIATEAVTNLVGRADLFAAISVLGGLLLYIRSTRTSGWRRVAYLIGLALTTAFGLFSKESAVAIVGVLPLYDLLYRERRPVRTRAADLWHWTYKGYIALLPPLVVMIIARSAVAANSGTPLPPPFVDNPIFGVNWFFGRLTALHVLARIWGLLVWPMKLSCDYAFNQIPVAFSRYSSISNNVWSIVTAALVFAVLAMAWVLWRRQRREAVFFILFFFVTYFPTSNLLVPIGSIMAERFAYLPMFGFIGCLVLALDALAARFRHPRAITTAVLAIIALAFGVRTYVRNFDWRSNATLWPATAKTSPEDFRPWQSYAGVLYTELAKPLDMRQPETRNVTIDDCISWCERAEAIVRRLPDELNPTLVDLHLGAYYGVKGEKMISRGADGKPVIPPEARRWYEKSITSLQKARDADRALNQAMRDRAQRRGTSANEIADTGSSMLYDSLGYAHARIGQFAEALEAYRYLRHLNPSNVDSYERIAQVQLAMAQREEAAVTLVQALWLDSSRMKLWPVLERSLQAINQESQPAVIRDAGGQPSLDANRACVQRVTTAAAESLVREFLSARQFQQAQAFRDNAVQRLGIRRERFDAIFREFGR